jgi:hypothetical protein
MSKQLRYVEISRRNPITRIFIGGGNKCNPYAICSDVCITIEMAGSKKCAPKPTYDSCGNTCQPGCDTFVATICAEEIDANGYAVFHWPEYLMQQREGWYTGTVHSGCHSCGEFPVRIGPRCNVIHVETIISGPDSACIISCDDDMCQTSTPCTGGNNTPLPVAIREPFTHNHDPASTDHHTHVGLFGAKKSSLLNKGDPNDTCPA